MPRPRTTIGVVITVFVAGTLAVLIYSMTQQARVSCEVCVTFHGAARCRTAVGPDRQKATETAVDNACGFLASGMAQSIQCSRTTPDSVRCSE